MKNLYRIFLIIILLNSISIVARAQNLSGEWRLVKAKQNGKNVDLGEEIKANLSFGDENRVSGSSGCNRYSSAYKLAGKNRIKFDRIISTRMACLQNNLMRQETAFLGAMEKVEKYQIRKNYLILFDNRNRNVLRFAKTAK